MMRIIKFKNKNEKNCFIFTLGAGYGGGKIDPRDGGS